jgi:hypothetical protein
MARRHRLTSEKTPAKRREDAHALPKLREMFFARSAFGVRCVPASLSETPARDKIQKSALPGVRAKGITSRMFETPVTNMSMRSKPRPKPECGTVP